MDIGAKWTIGHSTSGSQKNAAGTARLTDPSTVISTEELATEEGFDLTEADDAYAEVNPYDDPRR